jgi:hypothetical protein
MTEKSPRRWFRFGLRTLLIVVTVLCCYLAWETSVVRKRRAVLDELRTSGGFTITTASAWNQRFPVGSPPQRTAQVSLVRRLLGDEAVQEISYFHHINPPREELDRLARVFPEAEFRREEIPLEPCHPGCFPRGTLVGTSAGLRRIETIQCGDLITTIDADDETTTTEVHSVFVTDNRLWRIETEEGSLLTTETQPLCLADHSILQAGKLQPGHEILRWEDTTPHAVKVLRISCTERIEPVFNLILGNSEVFIAGGFLARSKPPADLAVQ